MGSCSGLKDEEISIDVEGREKEDQPKEKQGTSPKGALQKIQRYSFSTKREPGPLEEDAPTSKTISLSLVCPIVTPIGTGVLTTKAPKKKGTHKMEEDASQKIHSRKNDNKKVESEATEIAADNSRARITHSSAKLA